MPLSVSCLLVPPKPGLPDRNELDPITGIGVVEDSSGNIRDRVKIVEDRTDDDGNINVTPEYRDGTRKVVTDLSVDPYEEDE